MSNPSDFSVEVTREFGGTDTRWIRNSHGIETGVTGTLDLAETFGLTEHIDKYGDLPSGIGLGRIEATGRYGLFDPTATDGRETLAGFLFASLKVRNLAGAVNAKAAGSVLKHGIIDRPFLPVEAHRTSITNDVAGATAFVLVD